MKTIFSVIALYLVFPLVSSGQVKDLQSASDKARNKISETERRSIFVDPLNYVDPLIGTGGHGHTFPGAVVPFGMAQASPDTRPFGWDGCGGYHYSDSVIYGFANTHLSGTGIPDYSDVLIVPQVGKAVLAPGYLKKGGYGAKFSHKDEIAKAGFYSVKLQNNINVKLTATEHCAVHQYDFLSAKGKKYILVDLGYRDRVLQADAVKESNSRITGTRISEAWAPEQHLYFDLQTNVDFTKSKLIFDKKKQQYLVLLEFPEVVQHIVIKIGLSGTDVQGATTNLNAEVPSFDFELIMNKAQAKWRTELSAIQLPEGDKENITKFYTALYHAYVHPSVWSDVDGRYRTFNNTIEKSDFPVYSVFSLWDTYRAADPLYSLFQPQRLHDFIESFRLQAKQTGILPMWTLSNNETDCMIGYHSVSIIADAYAKGIQLEKPEELLAAMVASAKQDKYGKKQYGENGFISAESEPESVSKTLEYAYDDWCIAEFAKMLGKTDVEAEFRHRSASYMNIWNENTGFFQPRNGGLWMPNFVPNEVNHHYTEANAWQYSMAPQHNIVEMELLHGGQKGLERFLDRMFTASSVMSGREQSDITGLIGQYAHGNEPSHHMAYAYNYAGAPYKTQELVRQIMDNEYRVTPDGLAGNEDCGQMSAWFVLSSLGFYPYCPGAPTYTIGSPLFDRAVLNINGKQFTISAGNTSKEVKYVTSLSLNGERMNQFYLTQDQLKNGGVLTFGMSDEADPSFLGTNGMVLDNNSVPDKSFVPVPSFMANSQTFDEELTVTVEKLSVEQGQIMVSLNGEAFLPYDGPIRLTQTTKIRAKIVRDKQMGGDESAVVENLFLKFTAFGKVISISGYENHYAAGGQQNLIDGRTGGNEYRASEWQGFNNKDVVATIELKEKQTFSNVTLGVLQDTRAWIFAPKALVVETSMDGVNFTKWGKVNSTVSPKMEKGRSDMIIDGVPVEARFIRITAENFGPLPEWHISAGNPTWMFLDEMKIK